MSVGSRPPGTAEQGRGDGEGGAPAAPLTAYVIYSSFRDPDVPGKFPGTAVVERLNAGEEVEGVKRWRGWEGVKGVGEWRGW
jgi:hypothetical protein